MLILFGKRFLFQIYFFLLKGNIENLFFGYAMHLHLKQVFFWFAKTSNLLSICFNVLCVTITLNCIQCNKHNTTVVLGRPTFLKMVTFVEKNQKYFKYFSKQTVCSLLLYMGK